MILERDAGGNRIERKEVLQDLWVDYQKYLKVFSKEPERQGKEEESGFKKKKAKKNVVTVLDDVEERWKGFLDDESNEVEP